jgi:hypothetical protein
MVELALCTSDSAAVLKFFCLQHPDAGRESSERTTA